MKFKKLAAVLLTVMMCMFILPTSAYAADKKGITLNKTSITMVEGKSYTLQRTVTGLKSATVTWKSSDSNVASVSKGKVTAKKVGTAVITAAVKGTDYKATCKVKVINATYDSLEEFAASDTNKLNYKSISVKKSNSYDFIMSFSGADSLYLDTETIDGSTTMALAVDSKGNFGATYNMDGENFRLIIKNKKMYMLDPSTKTGFYISIDESEFEDYVDQMKEAFEEMASIDASAISANEKVKTCTIYIDGKKYTAEKVEGGCMLFDKNGKIYAIVSNDKTAELNTLIINEYSNNAPSGMFTIPKGYELEDMEELLSSLG